jgi:hypothetical protein
MLRANTGNLAVVVAVVLVVVTTGVTGTPCLASYNTGLPGTQLFHKGGTGNCEGCHLMHNSDEEGERNENSGLAANYSHRLKGSDPSSTCLNCHQTPLDNSFPQQHSIASNPLQMAQGMPPRELTPGGDFGWLKKNYKWGNNERSPGERHGHNIIALDYSYSADSTILTAPGGSYSAANLSCISCHDPHGNYRRFTDGTTGSEGLPIIASGSYSNSPDPNTGGSVGSYRLLAGKGYQEKHGVGANPFTADPPAAVAPVSYNRSESSTDTRIAYGSGMSEWCGNCHARIHNDGNSGSRRHPAGNSSKLSPETITNYNTYLASGNLNGNPATAYTSMVPFEMGTSDYTTLKTTANSVGAERSGPTSESNVMCLTCHRAHASGWDSMTRWNTQGEFIVYNGRYPGVDNGAPADFSQGRSAAEVQKAFYDRPARLYASYQRSLCNKCHAKD